MAINIENKVINGLWVGNELSTIEMLTLHSFTHFGHEFHLWVYEPLKNKLPNNVVLRDANEIISEKNIYRRKFNDPKFNIGKGSIGSPFSDLFRYKLLYQKGGWWVDMDVTCLKPFNISEPYFFRAHPLIPVIGNVIKVPPHSELMKLTYSETDETCNESTLEWLLPNKILNKYIDQLDLYHYTKNDFSETDWWEKIQKFVLTNKKIPKNWLFIHWMNEEWRVKNIDKNVFFKHTTLGNLAESYHFETKDYPLKQRVSAKLRTLINF